MGEYKPIIVLIACQFMYSGITLTGRAALLQDMSSMVFVVYRQCIAFLIIAPVAYFKRREKVVYGLGWKNYWLIFFLSLVGITVNQNMFFSGVYLASSSAASALLNLVPAITFLMAYTMGLEKVDFSLRTAAKIFGTMLCVVAGAIMAFLKGPKLLNMELFQQEGHESAWLLGCFLLFGSACCWAIWLTLLAWVSASYTDHLSLTTWMFFNAALQSGLLAFIFEPMNTQIWKLNSSLETILCLSAGLVSSITFFGQAWCTSVRGPLFSAMFNPLGTVVVTFFACTFMQEELYTGSFVGALAVIIGLYIVLWGKAKDYEQKEEEISPITGHCSKINLEDPLLPSKTTY